MVRETLASDERVDAFLTRPIEGEWPYLWIDATYPKVRQGGVRHRARTGGASMAYRQRRARHCARTNGAHGSPLAVGVNMDGRREVLGMAIGASEAEPCLGSNSCATSFAGAWPA